MLQFITNAESSAPIAEQVKGFIAGGGRWVQIRMKEASDEEITQVVSAIKPLCIETETFLILDDRVELAKTLDVGGVHLGKEDMLPSKARMLLGPAAVIGVTANTIDDIKAVRSLDVDYVGMGPFAHTLTKKNLAPLLGIEGIRDLCHQMEEMEMVMGRVAVGGIKKEDVAALMEAGVNGIAVSGAIANAANIQKATEEFLEALKPYKKD
ncbi:MAG: thiamine phosphate synthase [Muribaculaceae bacterium]|nr:thiamine phosphate synthase [Muribaculaceae bacterium]